MPTNEWDRQKIELWTWHIKPGNFMLTFQVAHVIGMPLRMHCTTISSSSKRPSLMRSADAKSNLYLGTDHDESNTFQTESTRCQKLHPIWPNHARRWFHWGHRIFREGVLLRVVLLKAKAILTSKSISYAIWWHVFCTLNAFPCMSMAVSHGGSPYR